MNIYLLLGGDLLRLLLLDIKVTRWREPSDQQASCNVHAPKLKSSKVNYHVFDIFDNNNAVLKLAKLVIMGALCSCCGGVHKRRKRSRSRVVHSASEPLLRDNEREAVSNLLKYLEEGELASQLVRSDNCAK